MYVLSRTQQCFIALVATSFGLHDHHQANVIQSLKHYIHQSNAIQNTQKELHVTTF